MWFPIVIYKTYFFCLAFFFENLWPSLGIITILIQTYNYHIKALYQWYIDWFTYQRGGSSTNEKGQDITRKSSFLSLPNTMACYVSKEWNDPNHQAQTDLEESLKSSLWNSQYIDFISNLCSYVAPERLPIWTSFNYLLNEKG